METLRGNNRSPTEFRNRLFFWGEEVKQNPDFSSQLKNENKKINLQILWIDNGSVVLHTNTERLYLRLPG